MATRTCKVCLLEKPYFPKEKRKSKASGFMGLHCWDCHLEKSRPRTKEHCRVIRSTEDGRKKTNASSVKCTMKRLKCDAWYRLRNQLSKETRKLLKDLAVGRGTEYMCLKLFGASREVTWAHFNALLVARGWTWEDYLAGGIEADHRVPFGLAQTSNELRTLALLENVQLLSKAENAIKGIADRELIRQQEA